MAFDSLSNNLSNTGKQTQEYIEAKLEYLKLRFFKTSMKLASSLINLLVLGSFLLLFLALVSFGTAMYLSRIIGYPSSGFFIMGGFYLLIFLVLFFFGKGAMIKAVLYKFSDLLNEVDYTSFSDAETEAAEDLKGYIDTKNVKRYE